MAPTTLADVDDEVLRTYVRGCHIMHHHHVVDAYGHLSFRLSADVFLMCRYMAPALVARRDDLVLYSVETGEALRPDAAPRGFSERYIHSEVYRAYPGVRAVIHSHSLDVVPFSVVPAAPLRACIHMAGFLGTAVPVWDATAAHYGAHPDQERSMLVNSAAMGASLARALGPSGGGGDGLPRHAVALMRGHGYVCTGEGIEMVVAKAIYTAHNARVQMAAASLAATAATAGGATGAAGAAAATSEVVFFDEREAGDTGRATIQGAAKPWPLWLAEVSKDGLYQIDI